MSTLPGEGSSSEEALFRQQRAVALDGWIASSGLGTRLSSESERQAFLNDMDSGRFVRLTMAMNSILLDLPNDAPVVTDELNVILTRDRTAVLDIMPAPEDKVPLLAEVFEAAKTLASPDQRAMVLGFGINAVHPFKYANGRVARATYALFSRDYVHGRPEFHQALGVDGDNTFMLDANMFMPPIYTTLKARSGTYHVNADLQPIKPKVQPIADRIIWEYFATPNREFNRAQTEDMCLILSHENLGPIIASLLVEETDLPNVMKAHGKIRSQDIFYINDFLRNADAEEMETAYDFFRAAKKTYLTILLQLLTDQYYDPNVRMINPADSRKRPLTFRQAGLMAVEHVFDKPDNL